jgi:hypothetical protein
VIGPCAALSLLGRNIRTILHRLGAAFEVFEEQQVHLVSQAANDLNFTFVVLGANAARDAGVCESKRRPRSPRYGVFKKRGQIFLV